MKLLSITVLGFVLLFLIVAVPSVVSAYDPFADACSGQDVSDTSVCSQDGDNPVSGENGIIKSVIQILSYVVGVVSVIMVMYGGFKYITSSGDPNTVSAAKDTILYALIGVAVAVFAQAIVIFVINRV